MVDALTIDLNIDGWDGSRGFIKRKVDMPALREGETTSVIIKVFFTGVCGSDRGIWHREAFTDMIQNSLSKEDKSLRILGHEFTGEIVETGAAVESLYGLNIGDTVSGDSHVTCGKCFQCKIGEQEVCQNQKILGISTDGVFAKYIKIPAKNLWKVDYSVVRPEICALYDPFGNAVHALSKVDVRGKSIAIFGCGQIGLFSIILAREFGATKVIAVDVNQKNLDIARELGAHETIKIERGDKPHDYDKDSEVVDMIMRSTSGVGVDISMEMSGFNSSVNNCLAAARPGGQVIFFGIKDGDFVISEFSKMVVKGLTMHNVIGRRIFDTWNLVDRVMSDKQNGVQDKIWNIIMHGGGETVMSLSSFDAKSVEEKMKQYPKIIFDIQN